MKIKKRVIKKVIAVFSAFILLVSSFAPYLLILPEFSQVRAQEVVEATEIPTPTPEPTVIVEETVTPSPEPISEPTIIPEPTPTQTPTP